MSPVSDNQPAPKGDSPASHARRMAERIARISHDVVESFQFSERDRRVARLKQIEAEILFGMHPVIFWFERRRSGDAAALVHRRLNEVLSEAVKCAGLEIPQYTGGKIMPIVGEPSPGAHRTASLNVAASLLAINLVGWAHEIEAEDEQRPQSETRHRLVDPSSHRITVWGDRFEIKHAPTFQLFRMVADAAGNLVPTSEIRKIPGCKGRLDVMLGRHLRPTALRKLIDSKAGHGGGYWLAVPDCAQWRAMLRDGT